MSETKETTDVVEMEVLPPAAKELIAESNLEVSTAESLQKAFGHFFTEAEQWSEKAKAIQITDASQLREMKLARETRLALREIRLKADKVRKTLKEDSLRKGRAIDGMANVLKAIVEPLEQHLMDQEKFAERQEAKRREELIEKRNADLEPYLEVIGGTVGFNLADMSEEQWEIYFSGVKDRHTKLIAEREEAEKARLEAERKREEEQRRIQEENARLKREAAEREAKIKAEREKEEKERREREEALRKEREEAEAKARKEREAAEAKLRAEEAAREKLEQEKREREEAEAKAKAAKEEAARRAANAPDREKLNGFAETVRGLEVPECGTDEGKAVRKLIEEKVAAFSVWITQQTESL